MGSGLKGWFYGCTAIIVLAIVAPAWATSDIVISQVYGGGGNSGSTYKNDFIELFNRGTIAVSVTGWSVQYGSTTGLVGTASPAYVTALSGTIQPGHYYLIKEAAGTGGTTDLPAPDATGSIGLSGTAGKVALVNNSNLLNASCPTGSNIIDFVGYGTNTNCSETSPTGNTANATAAIRNSAGCTDTDNNLSDFSIAAPTPRNSGTTAHGCSGACCNGATCTIMTNLSCTYTWKGADTVCDPNPCQAPTGSCCVLDPYSCVTGVTQASCTTGTWTLNGTCTTECVAPTGSCCHPDYTCDLNVTHANCVGTWTQGGTCDGCVAPTGACCVNGVCSITTQAACTGHYFGDNTNCDQGCPLVVISQVYGGGGNANSHWKNDFIELFNRGTTAVDVGAWSVQYHSATGTGAWAATSLASANSTIPPGGYYLVQEGGGTSGDQTPLPTPDATGTIAMSSTDGRVALVNNTTLLTACTGGGIVDFVGYGNSTCYEGAGAAPVLSNTTADLRALGGCTDTDNNNADFAVSSVPPTPRNSASPTNLCTATPGACCYGGSLCTVNYNFECNTLGGTWKGADTTCAANICGYPVRACCNGEDCTLTIQSDCGGTWLSAATTCGPPNPCAIPRGSCCHSDPWACEDTKTETECTGLGGTWQGSGTTCAVYCPAPVGSCCHSAPWACQDDKTQAQCDAVEGSWQTGACQDNCPAPTGACCMDGLCSITAQAACFGFYYGDATTCPDPNPCPPPVVINEVDSDTPSYDTLEFIELYDGGAGATALTGYIVVLYNGSNDLSYKTIDLAGYSTDANGYFVIGSTGMPEADIVIAPGSSGWLQNGADAVALYQGNAGDFPDGTAVTTIKLLDAIVYDTGQGNDLGLLVLLNPGEPQVNEDANSRKDTESNQRCSNGSGGARNTSSYIQYAPTPSAANCVPPTGACCMGEDCTITTQAECSGGAWQGANTTCEPSTCLLPRGSCCHSAPWSCQDDKTQAQCDAAAGFWQTGTCAVNCPAPTGACCVNGACSITTQAACAGFYYGDATTCPNPNPCPPPIVINEVDADTPSYDTLEFIELYGGAGATSLTGYIVVLYNGSNDLSYKTIDLAGYSTDANGYFVIGSTGMPEADIVIAPGSSGWLQNGADAVALYQGNAGDFPDGTVVSTVKLLDAIVYDANGADDDPGLLVLLNPGEPQVNEAGGGLGTTQSNQRCANGLGGARNTSTYQQWLPTPGTANLCAGSGACCVSGTCSIMTPTDCTSASGTYLGDESSCDGVICTCVTAAGARPPAVALGSGIITCDVVVSNKTDLVSSSFMESFNVQDATGGITVLGPNLDIDAILVQINVGSTIRISGTTTEYAGLFELGGPTPLDVQLITKISDGPPPTPTAVSVSDFQDGSTTAEALESKLVKLTGVSFVETGNFCYYVADVCTGVFHVYVPGSPTVTATIFIPTSDTGIGGQPIPTGVVDVTGIFSQYDTSSPYDGGYQLLPRQLSDIGAAPTCAKLGDVNVDTVVNGLDIAGFVRAKLGQAALPGENQACADYGTGTLEGDIAAFIADLLP